MGHGSGPGGRFDLARLRAHATADIQTIVELRLPFGIPGLRGIYDVAMPRTVWKVDFAQENLPPSLVLAQLEGVSGEFDDNGALTGIVRGNSSSQGAPTTAIGLNPDRWGRSWRSNVRLSAPEFLDPDYDEARSDIPEVAERVLLPCCACINRVLDALVYVGGNPQTPNLVPSDFWSVIVTYTDSSGNRLGYFDAWKLHTVWWGPRKATLGDADAEFRAILADSTGLPISDDLLVTARRKEAASDYRGAIIDAVCAVEAAIGRHLDSLLESKGISNRKRKEFLGPNGLSLALRVAVLLPLLQDVGFTEGVLESFVVANTKRNHIVHSGERADASEAAKALASAMMLIDCLRGRSRVLVHWDSQSFARPVPSR